MDIKWKREAPSHYASTNTEVRIEITQHPQTLAWQAACNGENIGHARKTIGSAKGEAQYWYSRNF
jgi:hypothetical protein